MNVMLLVNHFMISEILMHVILVWCWSWFYRSSQGLILVTERPASCGLPPSRAKAFVHVTPHFLPCILFRCIQHYLSNTCTHSLVNNFFMIINLCSVQWSTIAIKFLCALMYVPSMKSTTVPCRLIKLLNWVEHSLYNYVLPLTTLYAL